MRLLSPTELDRRQLSELHDGILTAIVEYDMHCTYITSHDMLPRKLKDLKGDQAEEVNSVCDIIIIITDIMYLSFSLLLLC